MKRFPRWRRLRSTMARSASPRERKVMRASPFSLPSVLRCSCTHSGVTWSAEKVESVGFSNAIDAESQDSKQWGKTKCEELYKSHASSQDLTLPYRTINRCLLLLLICLQLFIYVITLVPQRNQGQHHFFSCVCVCAHAYVRIHFLVLVYSIIFATLREYFTDQPSSPYLCEKLVTTKWSQNVINNQECLNGLQISCK